MYKMDNIFWIYVIVHEFVGGNGVIIRIILIYFIYIKYYIYISILIIIIMVIILDGN